MHSSQFPDCPEAVSEGDQWQGMASCELAFSLAPLEMEE